jgi:hypothetical protein
LLLEAQPGLSPLTLKERLIRTAESSLELAGMEYSNVVDDYPTRVDFPNLDPRYDVGSGFGLVDAVEAAGLESPTDVRFPPRGSTEPSWVTTNIQLASEPAVDGVANTIRVTVENAGDALATGVRVSVGTQVFGTGINHFEQVGVQVVDIPAGTEIVLDFPWLPRSGHRCAIATIDYALDSDLSNNRAQRNLYVVSTASPAEFAFDVGNPLVVPAFIQLEAHSDNPNWLCELDTASVALDPFTDCPVRVSGRIEPNLPGNSDPPDADGRALIGGVSIRGVDDTFGEATCHVYAFTVRCDVDIDGDVDRDDVAEIFDRRNTAASFGDPRDPNGDGIIDVNDARRCVVRCTNPRCAP